MWKIRDKYMTRCKLGLVVLFLVSAFSFAPTHAYAKDWELVLTQGKIKRVLIDKAKEKDQQIYRNAIVALCVPGDFCFIQFWSDRFLIPNKPIMTDAQAVAQVADYKKNPKTGYEAFLWNCRINNDPKNCFSE